MIEGSPALLRFKDGLRRWIPRSAKDLFIRLVLNDRVGRLIGKVFRDSIPFRGCRICTRSSFVQPSTKAWLFFGLYERAEVDQVRAFVEPCSTVLECGGSIGVNSVQIARRIGPGGRLIVIEPNGELCGLLRQNLARNCPRVETTLVNAAVSYSGKPVRLTYERAANSLRGVARDSGGANSIDGIESVTLRDLVELFGLEDYILVSDMEGAEAEMFLCDGESVRRAKRIISELDPGDHQGEIVSVERQIATLRDLGFRVVHRHGNRMVFERAVPNEVEAPRLSRFSASGQESDSQSTYRDRSC